jgi:hypothetical protein
MADIDDDTIRNIARQIADQIREQLRDSARADTPVAYLLRDTHHELLNDMRVILSVPEKLTISIMKEIVEALTLVHDNCFPISAREFHMIVHALTAAGQQKKETHKPTPTKH